MSVNHSRFLAPRLTAESQDSFFIRRSILAALTNALPELSGTLLDIGCGEQPYRSLLTSPPARVNRYIGMDLATSVPGAYRSTIPDLTWDGTTIPLPAESIDCAVATEVLEHSPNPDVVLQETQRVLRAGGIVFLTVPFLWPLHDVPHDQYRFTPFALERLLEGAGFVSISVTPGGGWDASLAQMVGLWAVRRPMSPRRRRIAQRALLPIVRRLLAMDTVPDLASSPMIPAMSATARKP